MLVKIVCLVVVVLCGGVVVHAQTTGQPVTLNLRDIRGRAISLSDYKGKVLLVNFWATWCVPCRTEIPDLVKKQTQYRHQDLRILGITCPPETRSAVRRFAATYRINYRLALGDQATKAIFTESETLPITVVIDRDGRIREVIEGIIYDDEFDQKVKPLLSAPETKPASTVPRRRSKNQKTTGDEHLRASMRIGYRW
jgi:peroxiredoxin